MRSAPIQLIANAVLEEVSRGRSVGMGEEEIVSIPALVRARRLGNPTHDGSACEGPSEKDGGWEKMLFGYIQD